METIIADTFDEKPVEPSQPLPFPNYLRRFFKPNTKLTIGHLADTNGLTRSYMKMVMDGERLPSPESLKTISKGLDAEMRRLGRPDLAAQATLIDLMIAAGHISPADIDVYLQAAATRRGTQSATAADPSAQTTPDKNP